jgi:hypothetical protein
MIFCGAKIKQSHISQMGLTIFKNAYKKRIATNGGFFYALDCARAFLA